MPKFGTKIALFGYFCARILKNYCNISSKHTQICLIPKCSKKTRRPKFGIKSILVGYFYFTYILQGADFKCHSGFSRF